MFRKNHLWFISYTHVLLFINLFPTLDVSRVVLRAASCKTWLKFVRTRDPTRFPVATTTVARKRETSTTTTEEAIYKWKYLMPMGNE